MSLWVRYEEDETNEGRKEGHVPLFFEKKR
jgi:hypothetical protein